MRVWVIASAVLVILAGCAEQAPEETNETDDDAPDGTASGGDGENVQSGDATGPQPAGVIATIEADLVNGTAPLQVNFTFGGTENATWSFDADGDGVPDAEAQGLPATANFTYDAGNWTANLTATLGNVTEVVSLNITALKAAADGADAPAAGPETWFLKQSACEGRSSSLSGPSTIGGCTYVDSSVYGAGSEAGALNVNWNFPADDPTGGHPAGAPARLEHNIECLAACQGSITLTLKADGETVLSGTWTAPTPATGSQDVAVSGGLTQAIPAGAQLDLQVNIKTNGHFNQAPSVYTIG